MSATSSSVSRSTVLRAFRGVSRRLGIYFDGIERYFSRRAAIASLSEVDDWVLRDIGLARSQIEAAVCGFVTRSGQTRTDG